MSVSTYHHVIEALDIFKQNSSWEVSRAENKRGKEPVVDLCIFQNQQQLIKQA
jgi:hypothetical protein